MSAHAFAGVAKRVARIRRSAGLIVIACFAIVGLTPASASAAVQWHLTSAHGPTHMPPGGRGQYVIQLFNLGDTDTVDDAGTPEEPGDDAPLPYTITDTLPAGVEATDASGLGWDCSATAFPATTVSCTNNEVVRAPRGDVERRGAAPTLVVNVSLDPLASGTLDNMVAVTGGGGADAFVADPTTFDAMPAGFGFIPGSLQANPFDATFPAGTPASQAGSHPFELRIGFGLNLALDEDPDDPDEGDVIYTRPDGSLKSLETRLPAGFIGNPQAVPKCPAALINVSGLGGKGSCPSNTQIGTIDLAINVGKQASRLSSLVDTLNSVTDVPVYNMEPPPGTVAAFAFADLSISTWIIASVDPKHDHTVITRITDTIETVNVRSAVFTLWGVPADPAHDPLRMNPNDPEFGETAMGTPSTAPIRPFLTLPSQCDSAATFEMRADSWQHPGQLTPWQQGGDIQATGCEDPRIRFEPKISIQPSSHQAASPTGLDVDLSIPQKDDTVANANDLYSGSGKDVAIVTPNVRDAVTHLPPGMAVNPSAADGLVGCSQAQIGLDSNDEPSCPDASKIGTVEIDSPLMADTMHGSIYQAKQGENPFGSLLSFYTVAEGPGLIVKLAAKVDADPDTGQLTTTFTDSPQLAFSHYRLHFNGGPRAPLVNPPTCGTYSGSATVTSWNSSVPAAQIGDSYQVTSGPNGKPCANTLAERPFAPSFDAKTLLPFAGAFSTFALEAAREDGSQELRTIETTLPPGMIGRLAGISYCPESTLASISTAPGTGLGERLNPSCPAASLIGHTDAAAGAGSLPFHNPGNVYLSGPRNGAPLSLAVVTPIVAGPLDLGSIVVRADLRVDPVTAQVHVTSDPLPEKIVAEGNGFPLNVRSVRVSMDRDRFTLNPTSCDPMSVDGQIGSLQGASARVSERFQVGACGALAFKPKLALDLKGATRRGAHPSLRAVLKARPGDANIARASVALPRSEFLDQAHIGTVCTRIQYAARACPAASVYGYARAITPLLDRPLEGPVYLRSSDNKLPDLVASLDGQIHIDLDGRIDTVRGGLRSTFDLIPDAPVTKFVLTMKGGKKGLLVNSRDLCASENRATVGFDGQNGRIADSRPKLSDDCGGKKDKRRQRR